jgi:nucleotide-binding universal stress UspA family protein
VILVATDGSESARAAVWTACDIARATGDNLLFVAVWGELRRAYSLTYAGPMVPGMLDAGRQLAEDALTEAETAAEAAGVASAPILRRGNPASEICALARDRGARMIVMGSHGWGALRSAVFGSVLKGVLHHASCPVLVVRAGAASPQRASDEDALPVQRAG